MSVRYIMEVYFVICFSVVSIIAQEKLDVAMLLAIQNDDVKEIRALIKRGANVMAKDASGNTLLHSAAENWAVECMKVLLTNGADVNARNKEGKTPFMVAENIPTALGILLDAGAEMNARDNQGRTALMQAAHGEMSKVKMLLQKGADVTLRSPEGKTAIDIAIETKHEKIAALLRGEIKPEIKCPTLETDKALLNVGLVDEIRGGISIKVDARFIITAGNSDDTFSGKLTLVLSDDERRKISRWIGMDFSAAPKVLAFDKAVAGFTKKPLCPELALEFSEFSISKNDILPGVRWNVGRFRLNLKTDNGELSQLICLLARRVNTGRTIGHGPHSSFNKLLNCAEYDRSNNQ